MRAAWRDPTFSVLTFLGRSGQLVGYQVKLRITQLHNKNTYLTVHPAAWSQQIPHFSTLSSPLSTWHFLFPVPCVHTPPSSPLTAHLDMHSAFCQQPHWTRTPPPWQRKHKTKTKKKARLSVFMFLKPQRKKKKKQDDTKWRFLSASASTAIRFKT